MTDAAWYLSRIFEDIVDEVICETMLEAVKETMDVEDKKKSKDEKEKPVEIELTQDELRDILIEEVPEVETMETKDKVDNEEDEMKLSQEEVHELLTTEITEDIIVEDIENIGDGNDAETDQIRMTEYINKQKNVNTAKKTAQVCSKVSLVSRQVVPHRMIILGTVLLFSLSFVLGNNRSSMESEEVLPRMSEEKLLCRNLMKNYKLIGLNGRPVLNMTKPIMVDFGLGLIQMDLDERNKILTTSMWARYKWTDEYLRWNPEEYAGVRSIKLLSNEIWKPDIMLYNTAETDKSQREVLAVIGYDGTVLWVPHQIFRSSCSIDVANFPFDHQECAMYFGSWTYAIEDVDPQLAFDSGIDLSTFMSDYKESCSWEIVNNTAERKALPEDNPAYVILSFTLKMRRKMVFSTYILTLPCVFLASLTLVVFWLPPDRPDRTSLAMSIFSSFLVLLLILVEAAPPTASSVPTLGVYYCFNMVIIMMSIFLSTLVVNICRGGDYRTPVPKWVKFIVTHILSRILCVHGKVIAMTNSHGQNDSPRKGSRHKQYNLTADEGSRLLSNHTLKNETIISSTPRDLCDNGSFLLQNEMAAMKNSLQEMSSALAEKYKSQAARRKVFVEWQCLALVMDRSFFYLYLIAIISSLVILFPRPDH